VKIGILAGAFNPVTRAHVALAEAAREVVDEIVCVLPRDYPHKEWHGAQLDERVDMLRRTGSFDRVEITRGGLFIEIARELHQPGAELHFICGRDAAERVLHWDYGDAGAVSRMLQEFRLLVASRDGHFDPPGHLRHAIRPLKVGKSLDEISSTEVRRRIASGEEWRHLVPETIVEIVHEIYVR
jgi:nicotinate (nicotinamide) nucleotide adenylyltransferase